MRHFTSAARKQLAFNIFYLALLNIFRWSNLRASFIGSLATREYRDTIRLYNRVLRAYRRSPYFESMSQASSVECLVDDAFRRARRTPCSPLRNAACQFVRQLLNRF